MDIQYLIVFLILAAAVGWIAYKLLFKKENNSGGGCFGCALSEKCSPSHKKERKKKDCRE
ncbi:MAG: FeoB-associated Cys-rich membrane protein [Muribaculaceae bacterium]|nr:FeoB-associated Cys-rich membrane protein [Muribaculaceae bacterium]